MTSSILLVLALATFCTNVIAECPPAPSPNYPLLERLQRAMVDCNENPGCNGQYCGPLQISKDYYTDCYCQTVGGGCLNSKHCDGKSREFKKNFKKCSADQECSFQCAAVYQHRYAKQIKNCAGKNRGLKILHSHILGPFSCTGEIDQIFIDRFCNEEPCPDSKNSDESCSCGDYSDDSDYY